MFTTSINSKRHHITGISLPNFKTSEHTGLFFKQLKWSNSRSFGDVQKREKTTYTCSRRGLFSTEVCRASLCSSVRWVGFCQEDSDPLLLQKFWSPKPLCYGARCSYFSSSSMYMYVPMMVAAAADVASHSSWIRGLSSTKCFSETLQNLLYFMYKKTHVVFFVFHFVQLYIFPYECPVLCRHRPGHS